MTYLRNIQDIMTFMPYTEIGNISHSLSRHVIVTGLRVEHSNVVRVCICKVHLHAMSLSARTTRSVCKEGFSVLSRSCPQCPSPQATTQPRRFHGRRLDTPLRWSFCRSYATCSPPLPTTASLLSGKTALITGASRGIGLAIAQLFATQGAQCVLVGRNEETLCSARNTLDTTTSTVEEQKRQDDMERSDVQQPREHLILSGDVGSSTFWSNVARLQSRKNASMQDEEATTSRDSSHQGSSTHILPPIDILVNAAGVTHASPLCVTSETRIHEVLQTNLTGSILGCKGVGRGMLRNRNGGESLNVKSLVSCVDANTPLGTIINVASLLGIKGGRGSTVYAASKAGLLGT